MKYYKCINAIGNELTVYKVVSDGEWYFTFAGSNWLPGQCSWVTRWLRSAPPDWQLTEITPLEVLVLMGKP